MPSPDKLREDTVRGDEAARILGKGPVRDALDQMREEVDRAWKESGIEDTDIQRNAKLMYHAIERFEACLRTTIANGEFARKELLNEEPDKV